MDYELGIIGAGNMAEAIVRGVLATKLFQPGQMRVSDPSPERRNLFQTELGVRATDDNLVLARQSRVILLSVKPQQMAEALAGIGTVMSDQTLVISIAAGITTRFIEQHLGGDTAWRVIRTMPNTPMLVGEGMVAIAPGANARAEDEATARQIFQAAAETLVIEEDKLDAVTALSGSGPAYVFFLVEHMIRAGIEMGLTPEQANVMARKTALGAAKMLWMSPDTPEELRRKVTSPGGTTHAAIEHMTSRDLPQIVVDAIKAAEGRGRELASGS